MRDQIVFLVLALPAVLAAVSLYWLDRVRRREAVFRWASASGYRLVSYRQPVPTEASPFPISWSKAQHVFRVEVEDRDGSRRSGWVRLGSAWRGLTSRAADVRWNTDLT
jgi:hypothetical protein